MFAGISIREFGRREGCSDTLVRKAVKSGKLKALPEGTIDPALVGSGWKKSNRRGANGANPTEKVRTKVRTREPAAVPDADTVEQVADELFAEEIEGFLDNVLAGTYADTATAERVKENALAAKHLLAARRDAGHLIEIEHAEAVIFETQRGQRDAWMNFPTRIGPLLAAELGMEADKVVEALTVHVHQQLDDLGDPEADFTSNREG